MNIPNAITVLRILLVPVLIGFLVNRSFGVALWLFLAAGASDALDGFIAKRFKLCTRIGAILDPLADKVLVVAAVVVLARLGKLPWWLALAVVVRDVVIVGGAAAFYHRFRRLDIAPSLPSKVNTFVQICLIFLVLAESAGHIDTDGWLPLLFDVAFLTVVVSGVHYVLVWGRKAVSLPA